MKHKAITQFEGIAFSLRCHRKGLTKGTLRLHAREKVELSDLCEEITSLAKQIYEELNGFTMDEKGHLQ
jgi:hypothetical protein